MKVFRTPMTDGMNRDGALWADPDAVAKRIVGSMTGKHNGTLYVPGIWRLIMTIIRSVPAPIFHKTKL